MVFDYIFIRNSKQHLVVEWLSWLPCKSDFINSTILETWKDRPNALPSLKLLEHRIHELVGRGSTENPSPPPPPLDNVVGSKRLRSGRVKIVMYTYKSFRTYSYNQKHENNFIKYFLGSYPKRFPSCIQNMIIDRIHNFICDPYHVSADTRKSFLIAGYCKVVPFIGLGQVFGLVILTFLVSNTAGDIQVLRSLVLPKM